MEFTKSAANGLFLLIGTAWHQCLNPEPLCGCEKICRRRHIPLNLNLHSMKRNTATKQDWIQAGYTAFSQMGQTALKVEVLAQTVGISKSSFYHHFADMEGFIGHLVEFHMQQIEMIAEKEYRSQNIDPELIAVQLEHKADLLFHRQVRINRANPLFQNCIAQTNQTLAKSFIHVWQKDLQLDIHPALLEEMFYMALENFFLQITEEDLNYGWLSAYFGGLKSLVRNMKA
jgi:AcrR family transcriptional regulator